MSLLEHPTAQVLLADAEVSADAVAGCRRRRADFLGRSLLRFYRVEQHELAQGVLPGKLRGLPRKTSEPIAYQAGRPRKPVQHFVGAGKGDDESVRAEWRSHVAEQLADPDAVLVLYPSAFPKRLVIVRTVDREPRIWDTLSNAPAAVPLAQVVEAQSRRQGVEELFASGKGEVG